VFARRARRGWLAQGSKADAWPLSSREPPGVRSADRWTDAKKHAIARRLDRNGIAAIHLRKMK
jgi:hypothetical protein